MYVPYGFGVGELVAVTTLAWNVYKSCKAGPERFANISQEVLSLYAALKEGGETLFAYPLPAARVERLKVVKDGCDKVLVDLQNLVERYETLGTQSRRSWKRMRWGRGDVADIRSRLLSNVTLLNAFIRTSQASVEDKLEIFKEQCRKGKREASVVSFQTANSLLANDKSIWRTIRKELEEIGISVAAFEANRDFIFAWFILAIDIGAFEVQNEYRTDEESENIDKRRKLGSVDRDMRDMGQEIDHTQSELPDAGNRFSGERLEVRDRLMVSKRNPPSGGPHFRRIVALLAVTSRPRRQLLQAAETRDFSKALGILRDEALTRHLDLKTLARALLRITSHVDPGSPEFDTLICELLDRGAEVNCKDIVTGRTPLGNSVANRSLRAVRLLLKNGADVNLLGPQPSLTVDLDILRLLLSTGLDVNARDPVFPAKTSLLQQAASRGALSAVELLIDHGAEIDFATLIHGTPLMCALETRHENVVRFLLAKGADPNFTATDLPCNFHSPINIAVYKGERRLIKCLLDSGAVPDESTREIARTWAGLHSRYGTATDYYEGIL